MITATMQRQTTLANQAKLAQLESALVELLADVLRRGFHGTAALEVAVQDGTIQHVRRRVERIEK